MTDYDVETVRAAVERFPELFGEGYRVVSIPDRIAAERAGHVPGETLFVAEVVEEGDEYLQLTDLYRATIPADASEVYFVAKEWSDRRVPADEVTIVR